MRSVFGTAVALAAAALPFASAQTWTDCNPLQKTCPNDKALETATFFSDFTKGASASAGWRATAGPINYGPSGAEFSVITKRQSPTIRSNFYIFFGRVEVKMKAAPGQGIISSIVLQSDDLDEIDWEFVGGDNTKVQTNFFGKGNTTTYDRGGYHAVASPQTVFHTYTVDWTPETIKFFIDDTLIRTVNYGDTNALRGKNYPQTPCDIRLGIWPAGDEDNHPGVIGWAGGKTDYTKGPFTQYVESIKITNYNPAAEYKYGDMSGDWKSIQILSAPSGGPVNGGDSAAGNSTTPDTTMPVAPGSSAAPGNTTAPGGSGNTPAPGNATQPIGSGDSESDDKSGPTPITTIGGADGTVTVVVPGSTTICSTDASTTGNVHHTGVPGSSTPLALSTPARYAGNSSVANPVPTEDVPATSTSKSASGFYTLPTAASSVAGDVGSTATGILTATGKPSVPAVTPSVGTTTRTVASPTSSFPAQFTGAAGRASFGGFGILGGVLAALLVV
ncbi:hypothetical protein H2201_008181 [Coniosporium apollinis]|uniref:chitinase n=1 Tax=Coniosporium apollinis TaxID=61459 RepID=A0ABQ9NIS4_9PEZI|nr:hypothetical protein H2201_008181 [Coniosporium apollinis]